MQLFEQRWYKPVKKDLYHVCACAVVVVKWRALILSCILQQQLSSLSNSASPRLSALFIRKSLKLKFNVLTLHSWKSVKTLYKAVHVFSLILMVWKFF